MLSISIYFDWTIILPPPPPLNEEKLRVRYICWDELVVYKLSKNLEPSERPSLISAVGHSVRWWGYEYYTIEKGSYIVETLLKRSKGGQALRTSCGRVQA